MEFETVTGNGSGCKISAQTTLMFPFLLPAVVAGLELVF